MRLILALYGSKPINCHLSRVEPQATPTACLPANCVRLYGKFNHTFPLFGVCNDPFWVLTAIHSEFSFTRPHIRGYWRIFLKSIRRLLARCRVAYSVSVVRNFILCPSSYAAISCLVGGSTSSS